MNNTKYLTILLKYHKTLHYIILFILMSLHMSPITLTVLDVILFSY